MAEAGAPRVALICCAARETGGGHLMRSLALLRALRAAGADGRLFVHGDHRLFSAGRNAPAGTVASFADAAALPDALAAAWAGGADLAVVDHYGLDAGFEDALRPVARLVGALDDVPGRAHRVDLLIDATLGRDPSDYRGFVPDTCRLACGAAFAPLDPAYAGLRPATLARRAAADAPATLLVACGASDEEDATGAVLAALKDWRPRPPARIAAVLGGGARHLARTADAVKALADGALHLDVPDMWRLYAAADVAVGAGGVSAYERSALGLPAAQIVVSDDQRANQAALVASGAVADAGGLPLDPARLLAVLDRLWHDREARLDVGAAAAGVCDGLGAGRAARVMIDLCRTRAMEGAPERKGASGR